MTRIRTALTIGAVATLTAGLATVAGVAQAGDTGRTGLAVAPAAAPAAAPAGVLAADPAAAAAVSPLAESAPIGFASVNALGRNGTTGGAGGRTVTATNADQFLEYIDSTETLIIQVQGKIDITSKRVSGRTRRSSAWAPAGTSTVAGWTSIGHTT